MTADRKYRIAMVAACPFPSLRGSQALVRELAEALAAKGHDVHVVTYPSAQHMATVERMSIHRVPRIPLLSATPPAIGWQKVLLDFLMVWTLLRVVRRNRVDVIHAHNVEAPLIASVVRLFTGVPVVYHAHNAMADELPYYFDRAWVCRLARWIGARVDRRVAAGSDYSIALSSRLGAYLAVRGAAAKTAVIPPAMFPSALRGAARGNHSISGAARIVYAGNLDRYQNLECLLEAFERVCAAEPRSRLVLLLHPATTRRIQEKMKELSKRPGVAVRVVGTHAAAGKELRKADVLVCPRTSWSGFPIKTLNYMAAGRPIVQARSSAHALTEGVNSLLFDDDEPGALSKAILRILRDPELADRLGEASCELAGRLYVWPAVVPKVEAVYAAVVENKDVGVLKKNKTLVSRVDRMNTMPKIETRQLASPQPNRRRRAPLFAGLVCALFLGCSSQDPTVVAPLPAIAAPALPGQLSSDYKIEAGDQIRVKFLFHPELDVKIPVAPDGNVYIPGVGEVSAEGKTAEELAGEVERISSDQLRDPEVTVIVAEFGERIVYVGGEVRLPGPVRYREGMTPLQAILDRGGFTEVARVDSVLHLSPDGSTYNARRLDYTTDVNRQDPELATLGVYDVIYVPRTFIGDANAFVRLYIRGLMPTMPRIGVGFSP